MSRTLEEIIIAVFLLGVLVYCSCYIIRIFQMAKASTACGHYKWEYTENNRGCRSCPGTAQAVCKAITPITKRAVKATLEELPEYLAHTDNVVRKAAGYRMEELLCNGDSNKVRSVITLTGFLRKLKRLGLGTLCGAESWSKRYMKCLRVLWAITMNRIRLLRKRADT